MNKKLISVILFSILVIFISSCCNEKEPLVAALEAYAEYLGRNEPRDYSYAIDSREGETYYWQSISHWREKTKVVTYSNGICIQVSYSGE
jgi:hypothetical protein